MNSLQIAILRRLLEALIPADDFPGAWEAGTGEFIQALIQTEDPKLGAHVRAGLKALDAEGFLGMDPLAVQRFLEGLEKGQVATKWGTDPEAFFELMLKLSAQGYYGDPGNGGNKDGRSWAMIGYEPRLPERPKA